MNLASLSCRGDGKLARPEVPECPDDDNHEDTEDEKSLSEASKQKVEDEAVMALLVAHAPAAPSLPPEMEVIFLRLGFS